MPDNYLKILAEICIRTPKTHLFNFSIIIIIIIIIIININIVPVPQNVLTGASQLIIIIIPGP